MRECARLDSGCGVTVPDNFLTAAQRVRNVGYLSEVRSPSCSGSWILTRRA